MLSLLVPLVVILLITLLTDLYTLCHINYYKHSTHHVEYYSLKDICKICHTHCNDKSIVVQKVDIPLKSTAISCILLASTICAFISINTLMNINSIFVTVFFMTVNIPMIVCLSTRNNFENVATARQRNNTLEWNRTHNQQWEIKCAHEDRIQNTL
jgi:hypothetical protein